MLRLYFQFLPLKAGQGQLDYSDDIYKVYLRSSNGDMVSLANLVTLEPKLGAAVISRHDLQYAANFYSTPMVSLGEAVTMVNEATADLLPLGYEVNMSGRAEEFGKTAYYMLFAFVVAIILVYMVLDCVLARAAPPLMGSEPFKTATDVVGYGLDVAVCNFAIWQSWSWPDMGNEVSLSNESAYNAPRQFLPRSTSSRLQLRER